MTHLNLIKFKYLFFAVGYLLLISSAHSAQKCNDIFTNPPETRPQIKEIFNSIPPGTFKNYLIRFGFSLAKHVTLSINPDGLSEETYNDPFTFMRGENSSFNLKIKTLKMFKAKLDRKFSYDLNYPNYLTFCDNYQRLLDNKKIPMKDRLSPALVFYKQDLENFAKFKFRFIDPLRDPFPLKEEGYNLVTGIPIFNIPLEALLEGLQKGLFPFIEFHDLMHFVAFVNYPWVAKSFIKIADLSKTTPLSSGAKRRLFWMMEFFSIPLVDQSSLNGFLNKYSLNSINKNSSQIDLKNQIESIKDTQFLDFSEKLNQFYEDRLVDFSGATSNPFEFARVIERTFQTNRLNVFKASNFEVSELGKFLEVIDIYRNNGPLHTMENYESSTEITIFNFKTMSFIHRQITLALKLHSNEEFHFEYENFKGETVNKKVSRETLKEKLKELSAMLLFTMVKFDTMNTLETFVDNFLALSLNETDPEAQFIQELFNNDIIKNYYIGTGKKRIRN